MSLAMTIAFALAGCWENRGTQQPVAARPQDSITSHALTAPLETTTSEGYYRFALPQEVTAWMTRQQLPSLFVFDAAGNRQTCGMMNINDMGSTVETIHTHEINYDPGKCGARDTTEVCVAGEACSVPDYCSPRIVDLKGTSLEGMTRSDIVATLSKHLEPVDCAPETPGASRECTERDSDARRAHRLAVQQQRDAIRFGLIAPLAQQSLRDAGMGRGMINSVQPRIPAQSMAAQAADVNARSIFVTLDRLPSSAPALDITWNKKLTGRLGKLQLTCYEVSGKTSEHTFDIQQPAATAEDSTRQEIAPGCSARTYRFTFDTQGSDLGVTKLDAVVHTPKPYVQENSVHYWFNATGTAPYSLHFSNALMNSCGTTGISARTLQSIASLRDTDWPPAAKVGAITADPRHAPSDALPPTHDDGNFAAWIDWLIYVGGTSLAVLAVVLGGWAWLAARMRR